MLGLDGPDKTYYTSGVRLNNGSLANSFEWCPSEFLLTPNLDWAPGEPDFKGEAEVSIAIQLAVAGNTLMDVPHNTTRKYACEVRHLYINK